MGHVSEREASAAAELDPTHQPTGDEETMFDPDIETALAVYCNATGHDRDTAIARSLRFFMATWQRDPYFMPERVCGRVREDNHTSRRCASWMDAPVS